MQRIRIQRPKGQRKRPWPDVLALDPRDQDVVRAKTTDQSRDRSRRR
jgi:hypothetical protein